MLRAIAVVPATPLLIRGASGRADALLEVRGAVREVLARELVGAGSVAVLGLGPATRAGRLRPTLGAAGIADPLVPLLARGAGAPAAAGSDDAWDGLASTGPSVALLALADAGLDLHRTPVDVVEVAAEAATGDVRAAVDRLQHAGLLVVADHPAPGPDAVVEALTTVGPWTTDVTDVPQSHEHLPASYRVTVHRDVRWGA